jgi:NADPH:quinone reductase-like Zn-dependent oxidoreductase
VGKFFNPTYLKRGINVGSRLEFEQLNRVVAANEMTFQELIDKRYPFEQAADAFAHLWSGKHVGKVVIEIGW